MKFIIFRTLQPKKYNYQPRYFDPEKEAMERRKAEMGLEARLSEQEKLRLQINKKWKQKKTSEFGNPYKRLSMIIYLSVILLGVYMIFFTDLIDNMIKAFGIGR